MKSDFQIYTNIIDTDSVNQNSIYLLEQQWGDTSPSSADYRIGTYGLSSCSFVLPYHPTKSAAIHTNVFSQINALDLIWNEYISDKINSKDVRIVLGGGLKSCEESVLHNEQLYQFFFAKGCQINIELLYNHEYSSFAIDSRNGNIIMSNQKIEHDTTSLNQLIKNLTVPNSVKDLRSRVYGDSFMKTIEDGNVIGVLTENHIVYSETDRDTFSRPKSISMETLNTANDPFQALLSSNLESRMKAVAGASF